MKSRLLLFLLPALLTRLTGVAASVTLRSGLTNEAGIPMALANTILLHRPGTILVKTELTGRGGAYDFVVQDSGVYVLKGCFEGYAYSLNFKARHNNRQLPLTLTYRVANNALPARGAQHRPGDFGAEVIHNNV